jgi:hypothetical protein
MHEIGHTMGLTHANENGQPYADSTGYMAAGYKDTDWPRKCFNGHKVRIEHFDAVFCLSTGGGAFVQLFYFCIYRLGDSLCLEQIVFRPSTD